MRFPQTAGAILVLLLLPTFARTQEAPADPAAKVDAIFARFNTRTTPGCAVAVERDGQRVLSRAYGMADLEHDVPITLDTVFEAGSVSKQFTAAAVVALARQGKLSLDDDVRKYIPEVPDYGTPITLRHMMQHTSGLRDWGSVAEMEGWPRGLRAHTHAHVLEIVSRQKALNFPTGSEHSYSNSGYNLMAILVDRVSGERFAEFTRKLLFEPLGMTRTQWRDDYARVVKGRAIAYGPPQDEVYRSLMPFENVHGNGGLLTTVGDLLLWNRNFEHHRAGGPELVSELQHRGRLTDGREIEYAGGLYVTNYCGVPEVSHGGATGGYRAFLARYPEQRLSVALLCNAAEADSGALAHQVAELYLPAGVCKEAPAGAGSSPIPLPAADLEAKAGLYRNLRTGMPVRLLIQDGKLRSEQGDELLPLSRTVFESRPGRARVEFDLAPDGRPRSMRATTASGDTLPFERVADFTSTAEQLAAYPGEYRSDEAQATYTVVLEEGELVLRRRPDFSTRLQPAYPDAFTIPAGLVRFIRGADGKVKEMSIGRTRVRDMRFQRVR
ncbi:MAG TPA: serine hydrolase domain-containing protein [Thermoanaerobaculia bacterium]|nr:serine hydrolase domain-containing protein [Thermoanaerobaculia bacterium]